MSYEDIIEAQKRQDEKKTARTQKRKSPSTPARQGKRACSDELRKAEREIDQTDLASHMARPSLIIA
jgi:hypothetical protein